MRQHYELEIDGEVVAAARVFNASRQRSVNIIHVVRASVAILTKEGKLLG